MSLWVSAAALAVCVANGIYLLRRRRKRRSYLAGGIILLLAGAAFALYTAVTILFIGAID